jgi:hypothetical protein
MDAGVIFLADCGDLTLDFWGKQDVGAFRTAGANKGRAGRINAERHEGQWRVGSGILMVIGRAGRGGPPHGGGGIHGHCGEEPLRSGVSGSRAV